MHSLIVREKFPSREKRVTADILDRSGDLDFWYRSCVSDGEELLRYVGLPRAPWHVS